MPKITKSNLLSELLKYVPEFKKIHEKEKEDHDCGDTIVMGDFHTFTEEAVKKRKTKLVKRIADFLTRSYAEGDEYTKEVIITGFFEGMEIRASAYFYRFLRNPLQKDVITHYKGYMNPEWNSLFQKIINK